MKTKPFPKIVLLRWAELDAGEEPFLAPTNDDYSDLETGQTHAVAEYRLVRTCKVTPRVDIKVEGTRQYRG